MPGPTGNPYSRRAGRRGLGFDVLPAEGRLGAPPPYPLKVPDDGRADRRAALWAELWSTPMALSWERHRWAGAVARYVEMVLRVEADLGSAPVSLLGELRQLEGALLMTHTALLRARTSIGEPGAGASVTPLHGVIVDLSDRTRHLDADALDERGPAC